MEGVSRPKVMASDDHWSAVIAGMMDVVHDRRGTAAAIGRNLPYTVAGENRNLSGSLGLRKMGFTMKMKSMNATVITAGSLRLHRLISRALRLLCWRKMAAEVVQPIL